MKDTEAKYNFKRVKISFAAVVTLVFLAGALQLALTLIPPNDGGGASGEENADVAHETEEANVAEPSDQSAVTAKSKAQNGNDSDRRNATTSDNTTVDNKAADSSVRADRVAGLKGLVLDGDNISSDKANSIAAEERDFTKHVEFIDQRETLPAGCEIVALNVVLRSMGHDVDPQDLADNYVNMDGSFPESYSGSPYTNGGGLPPCIAAAGEAWLSEHLKGYRAYDSTGSSFDALATLVEEGYPILTWTTEGMIEPSDIREFGAHRWYWPEHCVVVYGVNGDAIQICDSIAGMTECERAKLAEIYEACGSMSVAILPI